MPDASVGIAASRRDRVIGGPIRGIADPIAERPVERGETALGGAGDVGHLGRIVEFERVVPVQDRAVPREQGRQELLEV